MHPIDTEERRPRRVFVVLAVCAALSLAAGIGLLAWGIGKGNPLAALVGVVLVIDAVVAAMIAWRVR